MFAVISKQTLAQYTRPFIASVGLELQDFRKANTVVEQLQTKLGARDSVVSDDVSIPPEVIQIKTMVELFSVILGSIALLSLFNTLFKSGLERRFDFGVYKSLGMRTGHIAQSVVLSRLTMGGLDICVGVPLGIQLLHAMNNFVSNLTGSGDLTMSTPWSTLIWVLAAVRCSPKKLAEQIPSTRARKLRSYFSYSSSPRG